jgi:hypothetical protein
MNTRALKRLLCVVGWTVGSYLIAFLCAFVVGAAIAILETIGKEIRLTKEQTQVIARVTWASALVAPSIVLFQSNRGKLPGTKREMRRPLG